MAVMNPRHPVADVCAPTVHCHRDTGDRLDGAFAAARPGDHGTSKKLDAGKAPVVQGFMRYFARAMVAVAYISEYGDRKYAPPEGPHFTTGWQEVPDGESRYGDADGRHRVKPAWEGDYDAESEMAHLAHKAWNAMAELEIALKTKRVQCRVGNVIIDGKPMLGTAKVVELDV